MSFDPTTHLSKAFETFQKMSSEGFARAMTFYGEIDKLEAKGVERTTVAIDEMSLLGKETLTFAAQLGAEWRRITLETLKEASAAFTPKASG
jgi:hypothetical protein